MNNIQYKIADIFMSVILGQYYWSNGLDPALRKINLLVIMNMTLFICILLYMSITDRQTEERLSVIDLLLHYQINFIYHELDRLNKFQYTKIKEYHAD